MVGVMPVGTLPGAEGPHVAFFWSLRMDRLEAWRERAAELGARWLFWGEQEAVSYPNSTEPWKTECHLQAEGAWGALYDLTRPAKRSEAGGAE